MPMTLRSACCASSLRPGSAQSARSSEERLQAVGVTPSDPDLRALVDGFNAMAERLNELLYGYHDYALVITKPMSSSSGGEPVATA